MGSRQRASLSDLAKGRLETGTQLVFRARWQNPKPGRSWDAASFDKAGRSACQHPRYRLVSREGCDAHGDGVQGNVTGLKRKRRRRSGTCGSLSGSLGRVTPLRPEPPAEVPPGGRDLPQTRRLDGIGNWSNGHDVRCGDRAVLRLGPLVQSGDWPIHVADPTGFAAGDANLYRYVGDNPATMTDPGAFPAAGAGTARGTRAMCRR